MNNLDLIINSLKNNPLILDKYINSFGVEVDHFLKNLNIDIEKIKIIEEKIYLLKNNKLSTQDKYEIKEISFLLKEKQKKILFFLKDISEKLSYLDKIENKNLFKEKIRQLEENKIILKQLLFSLEILNQNSLLILNL
jgi:hypothetical protein